MVTKLGNEERVVNDLVDDPVLVVDAARPVALKSMLQRFWLANTAEGLSLNI
jgi:2-C-methyl-D-erythritol 4-phosphate cytidylyltransferase